jgi:cell division protein FtsI (penicillin-binding protein 3)
MAILEDKVADTSTVWYVWWGDKIFRKGSTGFYKGGYGKISLARGSELSSNTVMVQAVYENYKIILQNLSTMWILMDLRSWIWIWREGRPVIPQPSDKLV